MDTREGRVIKGPPVCSLPRPQGPEFLPVVVLSVCQLLCFPFALDVDADLLVGILADLRDSEVAICLLQVLDGVIQVPWWERKMASVVSSDSHPSSSRALLGPHRGGPLA